MAAIGLAGFTMPLLLLAFFSACAAVAFGMAFVTEGKYTSDWLKMEHPNGFCREVITILGGTGGNARNLRTGMVLGKATKGAATATAGAGNTGGSGTIASVTVSAGAKLGVYHLVCIEPGANAGIFSVEDPDGINLGVATVGVEFSAGGLTFTITDATDFVAGDSFIITVAAGTGKYVQFNQDGTTGIEAAAGILICDANGEPAVVAPDGTDIQAVALVRGPAIVNANQITWPSDIEAGEKAAAVAQLEALGIRVREGA